MQMFLSRSFDITDDDVNFLKQYDLCSLMRHFHKLVDEHAMLLKVDANTMLKEHNAIWVITRVRVDIDRMPVWHDKIEVQTWPLAPNIVRMERACVFSDDRGEFARMSSEWCLLSRDTFRPLRPSQAGYPVELKHRTEKVTPDYTRMAPVYADKDKKFEHTVRVSDLDMNVHMNNVAYIRLACDAFSAKEVESKKLRSFEIVFKSQSFEGESMSVLRKDNEDGSVNVSAVKQASGERVFDTVFVFTD